MSAKEREIGRYEAVSNSGKPPWEIYIYKKIKTSGALVFRGFIVKPYLMKSDSWLTLSVLKSCSLPAPRSWPRVLRCPQPRSYKNSPLKHKHWPSRSHLTTNLIQSCRKALRRRLSRTLALSSYTYPYCARGQSSDVILNALFYISMSPLWDRPRSKERNMCVRSVRRVGSNKSHKKNLIRVHILYRGKKSKRRKEVRKRKVSGMYFHKVPYRDHVCQCDGLVRYITVESVWGDLCYFNAREMKPV